jgi:HD superfamily phosphodiesterase
MKLDDIEIPKSSAAVLASEVCSRFHSPALVNHCTRAYVWSAHYAGERAIAFDAELLYVSAMLHDLGLTPEFDSHTVDFENAGGHVAWVFSAGAGWPPERRDRAAEIIVRHMRNDIGLELDAEGHLLGIATSLDTSGAHPEHWPEEFRDEVMTRYPLLDLGPEFLACFQDQAARKPQSAAAASVAGGIAQRVARAWR